MSHRPYRILFLCMGNICRSPAGEGILQHLAAAQGLDDALEIDSAGTLGYHEGSAADPRMRKAAAKRGYTLSSRARQITAADLDDFDLILAMDRDNLAYAENLAKGSEHRAELKLFGELCTEHSITDVPDPYYGGGSGFDTVLDLLEDGCRGLLDTLDNRRKDHRA